MGVEEAKALLRAMGFKTAVVVVDPPVKRAVKAETVSFPPEARNQILIRTT
jgi:hypothetical protein